MGHPLVAEVRGGLTGISSSEPTPRTFTTKHGTTATMNTAEIGRAPAVRAVTINGEPWWVAKDVCAILGLANSRQVLTRLDEDEKGVHKVDTPSGDADEVHSVPITDALDDDEKGGAQCAHPWRKPRPDGDQRVWPVLPDPSDTPAPTAEAIAAALGVEVAELLEPVPT